MYIYLCICRQVHFRTCEEKRCFAVRSLQRRQERTVVNRPVFRPMARVLIRRAIEQGAPAYNVDHSAELRETSLHDRHIKHQQWATQDPAAWSNREVSGNTPARQVKWNAVCRSIRTKLSMRIRGSNCPIRYFVCYSPSVHWDWLWATSYSRLQPTVAASPCVSTLMLKLKSFIIF